MDEEITSIEKNNTYKFIPKKKKVNICQVNIKKALSFLQKNIMFWNLQTSKMAC